MKIYRQVKASERLPEKEGWYFCTWTDGTHSEEEFINNEFWVSEYDTENHDEITDWLEEIDITEEEIINIIIDNIEDSDDDSTIIIHTDKLAKAILKKLEDKNYG